MMNPIIQKQLNQVCYADLTNFDAARGVYFIPKKTDIKLEEDNVYIIELKPSAFTNAVVRDNWNGGNLPKYSTMKIDISKKMGKMIKVVGIQYDSNTDLDLGNFWAGWLSQDDLTIIKKFNPQKE